MRATGWVLIGWVLMSLQRSGSKLILSFPMCAALLKTKGIHSYNELTSASITICLHVPISCFARICACFRICMHMRAHVWLFVCMYAWVCLCLCPCVHACVRACVRACVCVFVRVCISACEALRTDCRSIVRSLLIQNSETKSIFLSYKTLDFTKKTLSCIKPTKKNTPQAPGPSPPTPAIPSTLSLPT